MAKITESLSSSIKDKVFGIAKSKVATKENPDALLGIISKNFMVMSAMAKDMNVASQNIKELVRVMGGKASDTEDKVAGSGLTSDERGRKLAVELEKDKEKEEPKKPSLISKLGKKASDKFKSTKVGQKVTGKFAELKKAFNPAKIFKSLTKYLVIGALIGVIFVSFKDAFVEWATGLGSVISEKFNEFTASIGQWFQDTIQPIFERVKGLITPIIETIANAFGKLGDFIVDYLGFWKDAITSPIETIKKIYDGFMNKINKLIDMLPEFVKKKLGIGKKEAPVDDTAERAKFERQQKEALERQETNRVKKLEKEKQYTGDDEIVRKRLDLPEKTETMRREAEVAKAPTPVEPAPPPAPIVVPGPMPAPAAPKPAPGAPKVKAPVAAPKEIPKPISAEPPTAVGKAAEPPGKQTSGGSLASVATLQPGVDLSGLHPEFEKRLVNMATAFKEQTGKKVLITSGYRSNEKQAELYKAKVAQLGGDERAAGKLVARPMPPLGTGKGSFHLKGLAIDMNSKGPGGINALAGSRDNPTGWLEKYGLIRNVPKEDWHIQPSGTLPTADNPENPGAPTLVAGKDGKPMNLASGKKESIGQPEAKSSSASGGAVAAASSDVASGQRQQQKPSTPIIVNAPTTNTTVISKNQAATPPPKTDSARSLAARVA